MSKIYIYLDETGKQAGDQFVVSLVVISSDSADAFSTILEAIEKSSQKGKVKWSKAELTRKKRYIAQLLKTVDLFDHIYAVTFPNMTHEILQKCDAINLALNLYPLYDQNAPDKEKTRVHLFVDGKLSRREQDTYKARLKPYRVKVYKVTGVNDENSSIIRLADAICGLTRNYHEKHKQMIPLYKQAVEKGLIIEGV